jgi:tetrapyrrole methylase family protein/MazG family protein
MEVYPDDHPVTFVHAAGTADQLVEALPLHAIDQSPHIGLLSALYVPPLAVATSLEGFQEIVAHLRAPDGCPWDREQTHLSLRPYLLEEAYEVLAALDASDPEAMREELGDLLLQIVLHAQIANEEGEFRMADIIQGIQSKLVRRHPHVFGDLNVDGVNTVLQNWEKLKAAERKHKGKEHASIFDGVPVALPALSQAEQLQARAARVGFEWPELQQVYEKVQEELHEIHQAETDEERHWEIGDILFAMVNLARTLKVEPESALREASIRFRARFRYIEEKARLSGRTCADFTIEEMLAFWNEAKNVAG